MSQRADEVKVGALVILTGLLLFFTVVMVKRYSVFRTETPLRYTARFSFVAGLTEGAPVRYGGLTVGRVERMRVVTGEQDLIEVELSVQSGTPVRRDSLASITTLGLLGDNYVEISPGSSSSELLPQGGNLQVKQLPGLPEIFARADLAMGDARKLIQDLNLQVNRISDRADVLLADMDQTFSESNQARLASILSETDQLIREARPSLNATLLEVQSATARIRPLLDNVDAAVLKVDRLVSNFDGTVAENRPLLHQTLQDLDATLLEARGAVQDIRAVLQANRSSLNTVMENLAASSDNIRDFTATIRQYPFSLIRMPEQKPRIPPEIKQ